MVQKNFAEERWMTKKWRMIKGNFEMKHPPSLRTMKVGRRDFQKIYICGNQSPQKGMNGRRQAFFLVSDLRTFQFLSVVYLLKTSSSILHRFIIPYCWGIFFLLPFEILSHSLYSGDFVYVLANAILPSFIPFFFQAWFSCMLSKSLSIEKIAKYTATGIDEGRLGLFHTTLPSFIPFWMDSFSFIFQKSFLPSIIALSYYTPFSKMLLSHHPFLSDGLGFCRSFFQGLFYHPLLVFHFIFLGVGRIISNLSFVILILLRWAGVSISLQFSSTIPQCSMVPYFEGWGLDRFSFKNACLLSFIPFWGDWFPKIYIFWKSLLPTFIVLRECGCFISNFPVSSSIELLCRSFCFRGRDFSVSWQNSLVPSLSSLSSMVWGGKLSALILFCEGFNFWIFFENLFYHSIFLGNADFSFIRLHCCVIEFFGLPIARCSCAIPH